jgi:hypothetical protein
MLSAIELWEIALYKWIIIIIKIIIIIIIIDNGSRRMKSHKFLRLLYKFFIKLFCEINFETNDSDINYILLQRRFDASCIIFKLKIQL